MSSRRRARMGARRRAHSRRSEGPVRPRVLRAACPGAVLVKRSSGRAQVKRRRAGPISAVTYRSRRTITAGSREALPRTRSAALRPHRRRRSTSRGAGGRPSRRARASRRAGEPGPRRSYVALARRARGDRGVGDHDRRRASGARAGGWARSRLASGSRGSITGSIVGAGVGRVDAGVGADEAVVCGDQQARPRAQDLAALARITSTARASLPCSSASRTRARPLGRPS